MFLRKDINKKHKVIKKGLSCQSFEYFSDRITSLINFDAFKKPLPDFEEVSRLTVPKIEMQKKMAMKSKFSQINNKRFYFADGITCLLFLTLTYKGWLIFKTKKLQRIERYFWEEKETLLGIKNGSNKWARNVLSQSKR